MSRLYQSLFGRIYSLLPKLATIRTALEEFIRNETSPERGHMEAAPKLVTIRTAPHGELNTLSDGY
jgi:hypothetical protein